VHLIFRTILQTILGRFRPRLGPWDVASTAFRVLPTDIDLLRHMNNGMYLSILDLGRIALMQRSGMWAALNRRGWYPVVAAETITFRRSLQPWQRFVVESRVLGFDAKAVYIEQRFVVGGEIYARAYIRGRFLKRSGGTVGYDEMVELAGTAPDDGRMPEWLLGWGDDTLLPPSRASAPSVWS
jgi:acyl-CoA thioesterase FadM